MHQGKMSQLKINFWNEIIKKTELEMDKKNINKDFFFVQQIEKREKI